MKIRSVTAIPASIPYSHRELSAVVARDGVSDVVVRIEADEERSAGAKRAPAPTPPRSLRPWTPWRRS